MRLVVRVMRTLMTDDPNEPIMEGSDNEFSNLDVDEDDGKDKLEDSAAPSATVPPGVFDSSMDSDLDADSTSCCLSSSVDHDTKAQHHQLIHFSSWYSCCHFKVTFGSFPAVLHT